MLLARKMLYLPIHFVKYQVYTDYKCKALSFSGLRHTLQVNSLKITASKEAEVGFYFGLVLINFVG